jgi:hypothetical protein
MRSSGGIRGPPPATAPSPFGRRGAPAASPALRAPGASVGVGNKSSPDEQQKGWSGGPLSASTSAASTRGGGESNVLGPLNSAQGLGFEISHEIDALRAELHELRLSNTALQHTNGELHSALAQVTERSKLLSTEHARFLDEFRDKSQRSKQQLINDRQSLKMNLSATHTRLEDLERVNQSVEQDKNRVLKKYEELTAEFDNLSVSHAALQAEKSLWMQKEEEYLEIQKLQSRNLEELNTTVLQIQNEREGWHQRCEETAAELRRSQDHAMSLESTVATQEGVITQLHGSILTAQEEIMNLTQTLATHLEQIANLSKQNQELHAALVSFTKTSDRHFVEELVPHLAEDSPFDIISPHAHPPMTILQQPSFAASTSIINVIPSPSASKHELALQRSTHPHFTGVSTPHKVHSSAFISPTASPRPAGSPANSLTGSPRSAVAPSSSGAVVLPASSPSSAFTHPSDSAAYNFLHTTSALSTLHLPASVVTAKLSSYILWILEHKQILTNMMQRKEKLRKELEEQIVVANVEAQVTGTGVINNIDGSASMRSPSRASGIGSPSASRSRAGSPSPVRMGGSPIHGQTAGGPDMPMSPTARQSFGVESLPLPNSALPPPTLLLPSLLQHTLHDLHELTHLTQHDSLQFSHFEREKIAILNQCSSSGFNKHSGKLIKMAWSQWNSVLRMRSLRKQMLLKLLQRDYLRQIAWVFTRLAIRTTIQHGQDVMLQKGNYLKTKFIGTLLRKNRYESGLAQKNVFIQWKSNSHARRRAKMRICAAFDRSYENRIISLWNIWKENTLKLRSDSLIEQNNIDLETQANAHRASQLLKLHNVFSRKLSMGYTSKQKNLFLHWRNWSKSRKEIKKKILKRMVDITSGNNLVIKLWSQWKEFRRVDQLKDAEKLLIQTKNKHEELFDNQKQLFLTSYIRLRERYHNFKLFHWWRLAYVDTQWLHREDQWRNALISQKNILQKRLIYMHKHFAFLQVFQSWRNQTKLTKKLKIKACGRIFHILLAQQKLYAFRRWCDFHSESKLDDVQLKLETSKKLIITNKKKFAQTLIRRWRQHNLSEAFNLLYEQVQDKKSRKREMIDRILKRLLHSAIWGAFNRWRSFTDSANIDLLKKKLMTQKLRFSKVFIQRLRVGCLVPAMNTWREKVIVKKNHRRDVLDRTLKKLTHAQLWRALRLWKSFSESESIRLMQQNWSDQTKIAKKKRCTELIKKWRLNSLIPAWNQWHTYIELRKRKRRDLLERTCRRLENMNVWAAWRAWINFSEKTAIATLKQKMQLTANQESVHRVKLAEHMLIQYKVKRLKIRFIAWRTFATSTRTHKRDILDRTIKHLSSSLLGRGWGIWKKYIEKCHTSDMRHRLIESKINTANEAVSKWRLRVSTTPFINWRNYTRKRRTQKREVLDRMVRRITHSGIYRAWRVWQHYIECTRVSILRGRWNETRGELNDEIAIHKQKRIQTLIQKWRGASLSTRFQQWRIYSRTARAKKRIRLDQIMRRLLWNTVWKGWRQWKNYVEMDRIYETRMHAEGAIHELKRQNTIAATTTRTRHILQKTLDRLANVRLFSGWRVWTSFVAKSKAHDITLIKRKLEHQAKELNQRHIDLVRQHNEKSLISQQKIVDKTLRRIAYSTLYQALRIWKKDTEDKRVAEVQLAMKGKENALKMRLAMEKITQKRHNLFRPIIQSWHAYTQERNRAKRELMDKVVRRMLSQKQWAALRHWREWSHTAAVNQMRNELNSKLQYQKQARCAELIQKWRDRSMKPTFLNWMNYTQQSRRRKQLLGKIFTRLSQLKLYQSFRTWRTWRANQEASISHTNRQRTVIDRTFKRLCATLLYRGFRTWKSYTEQHKEAQIRKSYRLLRTAAVQTKIASIVRANTKNVFIEWRRYANVSRRERGMVSEMAKFRQMDVLDRTIRRIQGTSILRAFSHWRTYILRARLIVNDRLGEYSEMILQLRAQGEHDALRLHEYLTENQQLKSNLLSIKHKQHTMTVLSEKQREQRAILFAYNSCLARNFRAFYARIHFLRRRKLTLNKVYQHIEDNALLRSLQQWQHQCLRHRASMTSHALEAAKRQLDQCLGKVWSLEAQLAARAAETDNAQAEAQQLLLNAQAAELNHQLEKQMPNEREQALAKEVDTLAAKLELLLKEVKERGAHIQFLSAENQRLSSIVKTTAPSITMGLDLSSTGNNSTLNLSTSSIAPINRSVRGSTGGAATARTSTQQQQQQPTSSFATPASTTTTVPPTVPRNTFFPAGNVSFS